MRADSGQHELHNTKPNLKRIPAYLRMVRNDSVLFSCGRIRNASVLFSRGRIRKASELFSCGRIRKASVLFSCKR